MDRPTAPLDTSRCPLCGQANTCAMAAGLPPSDCWCMDTPIAPAALQAIPEAQRGLACICPRCAAGLPAQAAPQPPTPGPTTPGR